MSPKIPEDDQTAKWQKLRFQLHTVAAAILALLVTLNVIDQATSEDWIEVTTQVLGIIGLLLPLVMSILARRNSNPATTAVLPVPVDQVQNLQTSGGDLVAGPASTYKTGTVIPSPNGDELI